MGTMHARLLSTWSFGLRGHDAAWPDLSRGGSAVNAAEQVCRVVEADPEVDSVGYGGLPDAAGRMTFDAAFMLAPDTCGAVAAVSGHLHVASIARRVMERSSHVLLVGRGAAEFAEAEGFESAGDLLSDDARRAWEQWRRDPTTGRPRPVDSGGGRLFGGHDTIAVLATDADGVVAGACTTSGVPYKQPGRIGDCPIIGHGLYVHPKRGAAVATGTGELVMGQCGAFLAVELMAGGLSPREAALEVVQRIATEHKLQPDHQVALITVAPDGQWSSAALRHGYRTSVTTPDRNEIVNPDHVVLDEPVDDPNAQMT